MKRRRLLSITSFAGLASLAGCNTLWSNQPDEITNTPNNSNSDPTPETPENSDTIIAEFEGRSSTETDSFPTEYPQIRFDIDFSVLSGFTAYLIDPHEEQDEQLLLDIPQNAFQGTVIANGQSASGEWALRIETDDMEGTEIDHLGWGITVWTPELILGPATDTP